MKKKNWQLLSGLCAIVVAGAWAAPASAVGGSERKTPHVYVRSILGRSARTLDGI
jgi:hypothetical protein